MINDYKSKLYNLIESEEIENITLALQLNKGLGIFDYEDYINLRRNIIPRLLSQTEFKFGSVHLSDKEYWERISYLHNLKSELNILMLALCC